MVSNINDVKAAAASICAVLFGEYHNLVMFVPLESINTLLQHAAWIVAIIAGIVSILNGCRKWFVSNKSVIEEEEDE